MSTSGPLVSLVAYFLPDWTHLSFFISTFGYVLFLLIIFIPESPRWVNPDYLNSIDKLIFQAYLHGDSSSALETLNRIGKPFNIDVTEKTFEQFSDIEQEEGKTAVNETFLDIRKSPLLIKVQYIIVYNVVFYSINFYFLR